MSVEESPDGIILLKGNIIEYATKLFDEKEYFGAFARIHSLIEIWMQVLYEKKLYEKKRKYSCV